MTPLRRILLIVLALGAAGTALVAVAGAAMNSERIDRRVCETSGGGRFVPIPGFPGERIDRRLLRDVKWMVRKYKIFVTDGFSTDPVHSAKGEHPLGLALDIVPDRSRGGRWRDIGRLARWAEPRQNRPRAPFRWVGYNGDANHGRGHHLHLSWAHSPGRFGKPARTVYSVRCPGSGGGDQGSGGGGVTKPDKPSGKQPAKNKKSGGGGVGPGKQGKRTGERSEGSGGIDFRAARRQVRKQRNSRSSRERGGVDLG